MKNIFSSLNKNGKFRRAKRKALEAWKKIGVIRFDSSEESYNLKHFNLENPLYRASNVKGRPLRSVEDILSGNPYGPEPVQDPQTVILSYTPKIDNGFDYREETIKVLRLFEIDNFKFEASLTLEKGKTSRLWIKGHNKDGVENRGGSLFYLNGGDDLLEIRKRFPQLKEYLPSASGSMSIDPKKTFVSLSRLDGKPVTFEFC